GCGLGDLCLRRGARGLGCGLGDLCLRRGARGLGRGLLLGEVRLVGSWRLGHGTCTPSMMTTDSGATASSPSSSSAMAGTTSGPDVERPDTVIPPVETDGIESSSGSR